MAIKFIITDKGKTAVKAALDAGTSPQIKEVGFGSSGYTATAAQTALKKQIKKLATVSGKAASTNILHVTVQDESTDTYTVQEVGIYLQDGTLFAVYSQTTPIINKTSATVAMLAIDIAVDSIDATKFTFGDAAFVDPPATTTTRGIVMLNDTVTSTATDQAATANAVKQANDNANKRETPSGAQDKVDTHAKAKTAHNAGQISVTPSAAFKGKGDLQSLATALGTSAAKNVGTSSGQVMEVGAFGIGGIAILLTTTDDILGISQSGLYAVQGKIPTNWPPKAGAYGQMLVNYYSGNNASFIVIDNNGQIFEAAKTSGKITPWRQLVAVDDLATVATTGKQSDITDSSLSYAEKNGAISIWAKGAGKNATYGFRLFGDGGGGAHSGMTDYYTGKAYFAWNNKGALTAGSVPASKVTGLGKVATSNSYTDLSNLPADGLITYKLLTKSDDLNDITEPGFYAMNSGSIPANAVGSGSATMFVTNTNDCITQYMFYNQTSYISIRYIGNNAGNKWSSWVNTVMSDDVIGIAQGGTGAADAASARKNLGLSTVAASGKYSDLSGTPKLGKVAAVDTIPVANGGTGATDAATARKNLGLSTVAASGKYSDLGGIPTLAKVATSNKYSDLTGIPTLGAASAANIYDSESKNVNDLPWGAENVPSAGTIRTLFGNSAYIKKSTAALNAGDVGTYALCVLVGGNGKAISFGQVIDGAWLKPAAADTYHEDATLSGQWRCMGHSSGSNDGVDYKKTTLYLRVS